MINQVIFLQGLDSHLDKLTLLHGNERCHCCLPLPNL